MNNHVNTICKIGQGADCCRYLTMGPDGFCCEKHRVHKSTLDARARNRTMVAISDNCDGLVESEFHKLRTDE